MDTEGAKSGCLPSYIQAFLDAFDGGDACRLADLFAEDGIIDCGGGQLVVGRKAIRNALISFLVHGLKLQLDVLSMVETGDVALVRSDWSMKGANRENHAINLAGQALHIFLRAPGGRWEIKIYNPFSQAY